MLLHLLFPDHFERISSGSHKRRVVQAFHGLVAEVPEDIDQHLYMIRKELERLLPDQELDFYWPPLNVAWYDATEGAAGFSPMEVIHYKKQIVLYGPLGTGKTYRAKRLAEQIIRSAALAKFGPVWFFREQQQIEKALASRIHRLQLHPAYSYEDFIRGLHITANGGTEYRPGYLLKLIKKIDCEDAAKRLGHVKK